MSETTFFVARMMAAYLFITALGFFFSRSFYLRMLNETQSSHPITIHLSGSVHFSVGMAIVLNHFMWGHLLEIVVTLIGFAFLTKGVLLVVVPEVAMKANGITSGRLPIAAAGFLLLSLYLAYASSV